MKQVPGFEKYDKNGRLMVCKLQNSLYGLKQASRAWNIKLSRVLQSFGFKMSRADNSLFYRQQGNSHIIILTYVDDIIITGPSNSDLKVIDDLHKVFALKDLGDLHYFLGIEVSYTSDGMLLSQEKCICELLEKAGQPMMDGQLYRRIVGGLQYATITRPGIAFSVNKVSQYMQNPLDTHWKAIKRILRYLVDTIDQGVLFSAKSPLTLKAFSDVDWGSDIDDRKSTTGYCVFLGDNLISWSSKKQPTVSRSSTEAEYRSIAAIVCDVSWIHNLLDELSRTKHLELDLHFVRDKVMSKNIYVQHVPGTDQIADILTKPLSGQFFLRLKNKLSIASKAALELRGPVR
ncbi:hypothetical protein DH2020_006147 [Rehmannia glutinosa]|uniref:Reverse transcriptase Ty1/copia-type domain-containing protein n=1 Tax=Rehmannia glutinosa TaxID=99300 RepID=A0ABR0XIL7_REHGL